jgi:hypothetical protein
MTIQIMMNQCGILDAFINQVNANEGSDALTADEAHELRTQAEDIRIC